MKDDTILFSGHYHYRCGGLFTSSRVCMMKNLIKMRNISSGEMFRSIKRCWNCIAPRVTSSCTTNHPPKKWWKNTFFVSQTTSSLHSLMLSKWNQFAQDRSSLQAVIFYIFISLFSLQYCYWFPSWTTFTIPSQQTTLNYFSRHGRNFIFRTQSYRLWMHHVCGILIWFDVVNHFILYGDEQEAEK